LLVNVSKSGRLLSTSYATVVQNKKGEFEKNIHLIVAQKETEGVDFLKLRMKVGISKLLKNLGNKELILNDEKETQVRYFNDIEYSNYDEKDSEFLTKTLVCVGKRRIDLKRIKVRNPDFEDNPMCGLCYKKVTELFKDHLLDDKKTEKMVCKKCTKDLVIMRKLNDELEAKRK